jgi:4-amino-4-deoxy-L-arabinose transferase-like glycosyltransferase
MADHRAKPRDEVTRQALIVAALALVALIPFLGSYGFWDPQEIAVADKAKSLLGNGGYLALWKTQPPLVPWLVATFVAVLGKSELAARLPLALLGLIASLATYGIGARLRRPRAGVLAAVALLASPLFLFQARQLTSDIAVVAAQAVAMFGLIGLAGRTTSEADRGRRATLLDGACVAVGLITGVLGAGLVMGAAIPLAAACAGALVLGRDELRLRRFAWITGGATLLILAVTARLFFHFEPAQPGSRALFGQMLVANKDYVPLLCGTWRVGEAPYTAAFDWIINLVAFGMFPWSAVAPIAVLRLGFVRARDRRAWGDVTILAWATVAYLVASLWIRAVGDVRYPALAAIAVAAGLFLDDVLEEEKGLPVVAVFVFMAGFILSLDLRNFPETLASLPILSQTIKFPAQLYLLGFVVVFFGVLFAAAAAIGLYMRGGQLKRYGLLGAAAASYAFALFLSWIYTPKLSEHFSYRNLFEAYFEHRRGDEPLGVMSIPGSGPEYYARGRFEKMDSITRMLQFMLSPERVFVIAPSDRICSLHQSNAVNKAELHVVDKRNSRFFLFSNKLLGGERDLSPLVDFFRKEPPAHIDRQISANFEDTVELLGVDIPDKVHKGDTFHVTLWFKVKKKFTENKMIFMHFDAVGSAIRFQGDHQPVGCGTTFWQPGDIVSDTYEVTAGELTHPRGPYQIWFGLTIGGGGIWKNMTVVSGEKDRDNRVSLGQIQVD